MILNGKVTELARDSILRVGERGGPEEGHRRKAGALGETVMAIGGGRIYSARFGEGGARRGSRKVGDSGSEGGGARHREGVARRERKGSWRKRKRAPTREAFRSKRRGAGRTSRAPRDAHRSVQIIFAIVDEWDVEKVWV